MAYRMYLGEMLCPITPSKIDTKIKGQNKTLTLINDGEINILKSPGLTDVSFDLLLPNVEYPKSIAVYESEFKNAKYYLDELEKLKIEKKPFFYKVIRTFPNGTPLFDTEMKVSLEDYSIKEDAKQGFDVVVSVKLKQYKDYGTKTMKIDTTNTATKDNTRPKEGKASNKYIVVEGDTLGIIAKKFYGDSSKYMIIYEANKNVIGGNPASITPGMELTIPDISKSTSTSSGSGSGSGGTSGGSSDSTVKVFFTFFGVKECYGQISITRVIYGKRTTIKMFQSGHVVIDKGTDMSVSVYLNGKNTYAEFKLNNGNPSSWTCGHNLCEGHNITQKTSIPITWGKRLKAERDGVDTSKWQSTSGGGKKS
jgi:LysM repeat protein